mmetsp:Transcript_14418/g.46036  ORF Transcript_14418/g.46036 Transcript_14418/m.46036 type:complete len:225 (+) Transcript_14418:809-1483(+)
MLSVSVLLRKERASHWRSELLLARSSKPCSALAQRSTPCHSVPATSVPWADHPSACRGRPPDVRRTTILHRPLPAIGTGTGTTTEQRVRWSTESTLQHKRHRGRDPPWPRHHRGEAPPAGASRRLAAASCWAVRGLSEHLRQRNRCGSDLRGAAAARLPLLLQLRPPCLERTAPSRPADATGRARLSWINSRHPRSCSARPRQRLRPRARVRRTADLLVQHAPA